MNHLRLPLVVAFFVFLAGLLCGLRVEWVSAGTALLAIPILLAPLLHAKLVGTKLTARTVDGVLLAALAVIGAGQGAGGRIAAREDCRATLADGARLVVSGALAANHAPPRDSTGRIPLLPLRVESAIGAGGRVARCDVEVRVRLPRGTRPMLAGTELRLRGEWRLLPAPVNPSAWPRGPAYVGYLLAKEIESTAPPSFAAHPLLVMRGASERRIHRLFPRHGALADALLLNRREGLDREVADRFAKSGLVHLLAISGTHVALFGAVFVLLGSVVRLSRARTAWLTISLTALYLAVIGAPPSAMRAGIMMALTLLALVLQRPSAALAVIAATALLLLALDPMSALDIGFQLSFAGILGILVIRGAMWRHVPPAIKHGKVARPLAESLVTSVAAFLATAPIVAHHFGQVAPVSIVANLPAIPLSGLALVGIGAAAAVEPISPPLARLIADGAGVALDGLSAVVDLAVAVPGGHASVARPQWWLWIAAALAFLLAMERAGRVRPRVRFTLATASAAAAFLVLPIAADGAGGELEIAFLDVGQGDAVALRTPAGRWVLVDAGPADDRFDAGARRVLPYLRAHGAHRIEAMVLTHPHLDHIGGAGAVMRGIGVGRLVEPGMAFGTPRYEETLEIARERGVGWAAARRDRVLRIDGVELLFLWPEADALDAPADANDISAVVRVRYGAFSALLMGDAPAEVEHRLVERFGGKLRAEVLKAGHHGSRTSSSDAFLGAVDPELAVISAGARNEYGHPSPEVMDRLEERGVETARTDQGGTIVLRVDAEGRWRRVDP
jgi:competence protein ComEC